MAKSPPASAAAGRAAAAARAVSRAQSASAPTARGRNTRAVRRFVFPNRMPPSQFLPFIGIVAPRTLKCKEHIHARRQFPIASSGRFCYNLPAKYKYENRPIGPGGGMQ